MAKTIPVITVSEATSQNAPKPKPSVLLADGRTTIEGEITNLTTVEIDLAGQKFKIDLTKATQITVQAAPEIASVLATVVALVEGKEVARAESRMMERSIGMSQRDCFETVLRRACTTGCDHRYIDSVCNGTSEIEVITDLRTVSIHARQ